MLQNNNLSPLPFYDNLSMQNHRKSYSYGNIFQLINPKNRLLPFQIILPNNVYYRTEINLINLDNNQSIDISDQIVIQYKIFQDLNFVVAYYVSGSNILGINQLGLFYLEIKFYNQNNILLLTKYSEVFNVITNLNNVVEIVWYDANDLIFEDGAIVYSNTGNYRNQLYLCSEVGKPTYNFEETGEERDGYFFPEKQISLKTYHFNFTAPEYLTDVMRLIRLHDYIFITSNGITYKCDNFLIDVSWQNWGNLAGVNVDFNSYTVVKKIASYIQTSDYGDFNNDFDIVNDFN